MCVRYRYDETTKERWKTVELIIDKRVWKPPPSKWSAETLVAIRVGTQERDVRQRVKAAGGKWNPKAVVWELAYRQVVTLGLAERIVAEVTAATRNTPLLIDGTENGRPSTNR